MIRALLASALPVLGVGMAVAFVGPDLIAGPRGEPLRVAGPDAALLQPASLEAEACASTLLLPPDGRLDSGPQTRVVALSDAMGFIVAVEGVPHGAADGTLILVFDESGRLLAAGDPGALEIDPAGAAMIDDCASAQATDHSGRI
jgi:hypothetical protein